MNRRSETETRGSIRFQREPCGLSKVRHERAATIVQPTDGHFAGWFLNASDFAEARWATVAQCIQAASLEHKIKALAAIPG